MQREVEDILGPDGLFSEVVGGFTYRPPQQAMAVEVARVIEDGLTLVAEAGTGTGKTFAYLVPALLSGRKVIVSTGTRNLQDQLFHRDLPVVLKALGRPADVSLLKGRSNYLCLYRMDNMLYDARAISKQQRSWLHRIREWSTETQSGDINEIASVPEDAGIWPGVTSTVDNCLGGDCPSYRDCHLVEARRRAQEADLVVINHHLLCADFALKDEGFGHLLPAADCFIVDEAHQLPETATQFFGSSVSGHQLLELARDTEMAYRREANDYPALLKQLDSLKKQVRDFRLCFGVAARRGVWRELEQDQRVLEGMQKMSAELQATGQCLEPIASRGRDLENCQGRLMLLQQTFEAYLSELDTTDIRWFETTAQNVRLNLTPLDVAESFKVHMVEHTGAWVFTSATLAVGDKFDHYCERLGLTDTETGQWDSPFDYENQALLYIPEELPLPFDDTWTGRFHKLVNCLIDLSKGRIFVLFTSHRALQEAAEYLEERIDYPLFVQGTAPKAELLAEFTEAGNGVLLGTASFWEGVDVKGAALSCVVIDKLPFASPGDPVLQARLDAMSRQGHNPFMHFQLPQAVLALKQGAGRLIRDAEDRGTLVICDTRLLRKPYGRIFLKSLPPMRTTTNYHEMARFMSEELAAGVSVQ